MEELGSMWNYQESFDELRQKLLYTTLELETYKMEANETMRKHKEDMKNILNLLKLAYQERDEAKDQLQKLLNKLMPTSPIPQFQHDNSNTTNNNNPLVMVPTKANSSITESNSLSHGSSPVDSFFDAVSSPEFSNINMADSNSMAFVNQAHPFMNDPGNMVIEGLVKGKNLPQKGKLLQSVMEAGPLLQTLLVAGPLPRWRNPPPLQPFKIPPFSIKGCENVNVPMSRVSSQMCSTSMLNFSNSPSGSAKFNNGVMLNSSNGDINTQIISTGKRQRLQ